MRWKLPAILALQMTAMSGQTLVNPSRVPALAKSFEAAANERGLACSVDPIAAQLNFSLRFQTGYIARVPANQFTGPGHRLRSSLRVTPERNSQPVFLTSFVRLPVVPKTASKLELTGIYLVGEGRYAVDWLLADESGRICRKHWRVEAKPSSSERGLRPGISAGEVAEASFRRWSPQDDDQGEPALRRITVLLHAAPLLPNTTRLRPQDRIMLLGSLASLLECLPARSVRLIVFNLDQQKELFHEEELMPDSLPQVAQAMNDLQLQLVDYRTLGNQRGHLDLVAQLVNQEIRAESASDAVFFIGPPSRYVDKLPHWTPEDRGGKSPQFFYFQYKPYWRHAAELPDSIALAVRRLKGKTMLIHTPDDFAKAIRQVGAQLSAPN